MKFDIQTMPDNELISLRDKITEEIEVRKHQQEDKMCLRCGKQSLYTSNTSVTFV